MSEVKDNAFNSYIRQEHESIRMMEVARGAFTAGWDARKQSTFQIMFGGGEDDVDAKLEILLAGLRVILTKMGRHGGLSDNLSFNEALIQLELLGQLLGYNHCPHCRGEAFLGMHNDRVGRGSGCNACDGMGKNSGCISFNHKQSDSRVHKDEPIPRSLTPLLREVWEVQGQSHSAAKGIADAFKELPEKTIIVIKELISEGGWKPHWGPSLDATDS